MDQNEILSLTGLVEQGKLSAIVTKLVKLVHDEDDNVTAAYKALVGELGNKTEASGEGEEAVPAVPHTVKSFVEAAIAAVNGDAEALEERVKANEDAITLLNNNSETVGSVDYKITQAFNDFATKMSDDKVVNTFKELVEYAAAHQGEFTDLVTLIGSLPEDAGVTTIVAYIEKLAAANSAAVEAEQERAEGVETAIITAINGFAYATDEQMDAILALIK